MRRRCNGNTFCRAISEYGVDANHHRATNIYESDILNADIVLCMTKSHKDNVLSIYPQLKGKVFTIKEYVNDQNAYDDIDDPWGYGIEVYRQCAKEIVDCVEKLIKKL